MFKIFYSNLKIPDTTTVIWSKLHTEETQILGIRVQNFKPVGDLESRVCAPLAWVILQRNNGLLSATQPADRKVWQWKIYYDLQRHWVSIWRVFCLFMIALLTCYTFLWNTGNIKLTRWKSYCITSACY